MSALAVVLGERDNIVIVMTRDDTRSAALERIAYELDYEVDDLLRASRFRGIFERPSNEEWRMVK